jgi:hypothetical protein
VTESVNSQISSFRLSAVFHRSAIILLKLSHSIHGKFIFTISDSILTSGVFDKKVYASFIQDSAFTTFSHHHIFQLILISSKVHFCLESSIHQSNIQVKSGNIINIVGKSVSLFAISSTCLVTHSIKNCGKSKFLLFVIFTISEKLPSNAQAKSIHTSTAHHSQPCHN